MSIRKNFSFFLFSELTHKKELPRKMMTPHHWVSRQKGMIGPRAGSLACPQH